MYCAFPQVNQLAALLADHGVRNVVACPGSRNAPILHDLNELSNERPGAMQLHPVTDERSAAFVALGMALATEEPAAVCVTSGSALLGCLPAVAEAYYRQTPLLVISADRPSRWIGQGDGQTIPQQGALQPYCPTWQLCAPDASEARWTNNLRLNEALLSLRHSGGRPAHINVPLEEPLFRFTTPSLPCERVIVESAVCGAASLPSALVRRIAGARLPVLLVGQYDHGDLRAVATELDGSCKLLVLPEIISDIAGSSRMEVFDRAVGNRESLCPDVVVHIGGNFIHKRFKQVLRESGCEVIRIDEEESLADTFCGLTHHLRCRPLDALMQLSALLPSGHKGVETAQAVIAREAAAPAATQLQELPLSHQLYHSLSELMAQHTDATLHLGNSTAVRDAALFFESGRYPVYCNRGVNGIEGSLSVAVGYAMKMWGVSLVILGDLSFFYDSNALWNTHLPGNLRIVLVNNGGGAIFSRLPGLSQSPACTALVAARQHFCAEGLARAFHLNYKALHRPDEAEQCARWLFDAPGAALLEVFEP